MDEYTREALEILVERHIDADATVRMLERLTTLRGCPEHVRCDNGPELTAHALRDWCKLAGAAFIEPGAPWQNAFVESFNGRLRDELLDVEQLSCLCGGEGRDRGLARRPQGESPAQLARDAHADGLCRVLALSAPVAA